MLVVLDEEPATSAGLQPADAGGDEVPIGRDKDGETADDEQGKVVAAAAADLEDCPTTSSSASKNTETGVGPSDQKILKQPNKKIRCPRCDSANTRVSYNYNTIQPSHLFRGCRRYWTAGGTMRNAATVGSNRRRARTFSSSPCSQVPDSWNCGSTIPSSGPAFPMPNLVERAKNCLRNGVRSPDTGSDCSSVSSSVTAALSSGAHSRYSFDWGRGTGLMLPFSGVVGSGPSEETRFNDPGKGIASGTGPFGTSSRHNASSSVLQANPAALSRSLNFHESS